MKRQRYGLNPATGRVEHHYVDEGKRRADVGRGRPMTALSAPVSGLRNVGLQDGRRVARIGGAS